MKNLLFSLFLFCFLVSSCDSDKKYAEQAVCDFLSCAMHKEVDGMSKVFPKIIEIGKYPVIDNYVITEVENKSGHYDVQVTAYRGSASRDYLFFVYPNKHNATQPYYISESIGIFDINSHYLYDFAKKTGCITDYCYFDTDIAKRFSAAEEILYRKCTEVRRELYNVYVADYKWTKVGSGASIKGIVKNESRYNIDHVKYIAKFQDYSGNDICSDTGTLFYDTFRSNSSRSFSVYSSYIGNAKRVYFAIEYDNE